MSGSIAGERKEDLCLQFRGERRAGCGSNFDRSDMDLDDFRSILRGSGVDLWTFIDTAISLASADYPLELHNRRDGIVERLYTAACKKCELNESRQTRSDSLQEREKTGAIFGDSDDERERRELSPATPLSNNEVDDEGEEDVYRRYEQEKRRILEIKEQIEDQDQTEDSLIETLQSLADMNITFQVLKETDVGRHMNGLRKHPSTEVRRLVKHLVRKWKEIVDEWVTANAPAEVEVSSFIAERDSPQRNQRQHHQNGNQVADFPKSANHQNGGSSADRNKQILEAKEKKVTQRGVEMKHKPSVPDSASPYKPKEAKETTVDMERLASARKRLHENYKEAENAKKQRTIQVMDLHDIPKPKNSFFARGKGFHGRNG
ncbi:probable mediator of RNA polymerase II transcription subunit 26c isoform X2 [Aristolochia californica]|uniref:probable mediator of RNA polymerase II transcription subunit 26c isoform X2 n=1 Tax=Aristolochia californica TaxID=171875 RepID=UPI0035DE983B